LDAKQIDKCLNAICDANDTKIAIKTDPSVKANIDKGANFIPPEARIKEILDNG